MSKPGVRVVPRQPSDLEKDQTTSGIARFQAFSTEDRWVGYVTTVPGVMSGWHHHGDTETYAYIIKGSLTLEFGAGGEQRVSAGPGDFVTVPAGAIHREGTEAGEPGEAVVVRIGGGPALFNVDGPEG
jgi:uncharacterized RmlC-like cupin family protein